MEDFVVVLRDGYGGEWNCCGSCCEQDSDEVGGVHFGDILVWWMEFV
jgi:poly(3-hydroxybutyrate) depolymerase